MTSVFTIEKELTTGCRKDFRGQRNTMQMISCINMKSTEYGLVPCGNITKSPTEAQLTAAAITVSFPFPQLFILKAPYKVVYVALLCTQTKIYGVPKVGALVELTTYDAVTPADTKAITAGGVWHFVDMMGAWILMNGTCTVFQTNYHNISGSGISDKIYVSDRVVASACLFQNKVVFAGYTTGDTHPVHGALTNRHISWTVDGGTDTFWHFVSGMLGSTIPTDHEIDDLNDSLAGGILPVDHQGPLYCIKPMRDFCVSYGAYGVSLHTYVIDPTPVLTCSSLRRIGIPIRGAVGGNKDVNIFIDVDGYLWSFNSEMKLDKLGYKEYMWQVLGGDIDNPKHVNISYDYTENEFYIAGEEYCFILNKNGLTQTSKLVTSIVSAPMAESVSLDYTGRTVGVYEESEPQYSNVFRVIFDTADLGLRAFKTLRTVHVGYTDVRDLYVAVQHKETGEYFPAGSSLSMFDVHKANWKPVNKEGVVFPCMTTVDFRILLYGKVDSFSKIDYLRVEWELADGRGVRTRYEQNTQS